MPMTDAARFAYMQARIQARHGDRLTHEQWRQLDACRDLGRYLQRARASDLGKWVRHFAAHDDPLRWERSLRADWTANLMAVTGWVPEAWHAGLHFLRSLPALPVIAHLLRSERPLPWMLDDPFFADFDVSDAASFRASLAASDWAAIAAYWDAEHPVEAWFTAWRGRWPDDDQTTNAELERASRRLTAAWQRPDVGYADWRDNLERQFTALLRRRPRTIQALIGHIGLVSLDMIHLRSGLIRLNVAPHAPEDRQ